MFVVSESWTATYPTALVAALVVRGVTNVREHPALEQRKRDLEAELSARFRSQEDIRSSTEIRTYTTYYKRFDKTYHLTQQLATVALRHKPLPTVSALVDVMFIAELSNLLLTAGHDLSAVVPPVTLDVATGNESYIRPNGEPQLTKAGDMMVADREGILSSIIHGPDRRSRIALETRDALYVVYAPEGIERERVRKHLRDIRDAILLTSPTALFEPARMLSARGVEEGLL